MSLSTHVLDATTGRPAREVPLKLDRRHGDRWQPLGSGATDDDGRCRGMVPGELEAGTYRLVFDTGAYFSATGRTGLYPEVVITFDVAEPGHHHVPLLLSPFAYSTYRGS